uniref:Uncharacterized protein n=1 Tax=Candidatus Kentrum sp. UNK TaxID=2126344 RepID=A0A451AS52_9GAMM|nr:MAG: hypothetical protein BECKUNK1418H_GA0071006_100726 [Candidatus Kentron sp. UNK]
MKKCRFSDFLSLVAELPQWMNLFFVFPAQLHECAATQNQSPLTKHQFHFTNTESCFVDSRQSSTNNFPICNLIKTGMLFPVLN